MEIDSRIKIIRQRRKTLCMKAEGGGINVYVPHTVGEETIARFLEKHKLWIRRRLEERVEPCSFQDGGTVLFLGRMVQIKTGKARIEGDTLFLPQENRSTSLLKLCKRLSLGRMTALTEQIAAKYHFRFKSVEIGSAKTRWGTCDGEGKIRYTLYTAFLPDELAVYLCVHELCHTRQHNHSKKFWQEVEKILPDWRVRRKALKTYRSFLSLQGN